MKAPLLGIAVALPPVLGCCASLEVITAAHTGCPENEIQVFNKRTYASSRAWSARCQGRVYYCYEDNESIKCTVRSGSDAEREKPVRRAHLVGPCRNDSDCEGDEICHLGKCIDTAALSTKSRPPPETASGAGDTPPRPTDPNVPFEERLGVTLGEVAEHAATLGLKAASGAVVLSVKPGSVAAHKGLRRGDVIVGLDLARVRSVAEVQKRAKSVLAGRVVNIVIQRKGHVLSLFVRL